MNFSMLGRALYAYVKLLLYINFAVHVSTAKYIGPVVFYFSQLYNCYTLAISPHCFIRASSHPNYSDTPTLWHNIIIVIVNVHTINVLCNTLFDHVV